MLRTNALLLRYLLPSAAFAPCDGQDPIAAHSAEDRAALH